MDVEAVTKGLTKAQREAMLTLSLPYDGRPYSSTWRKSTTHWNAMVELECEGIVERKVWDLYT